MSDVGFILAKRSAGFSWQAIARMVRRSIEDVRRDCDPTYVVTFTPLQPAKTIPRKPVVYFDAEGKLAPGQRQRFILETLYNARLPVPLSVLGGYTAAVSIMGMRRRWGEGIIGSKQGCGYWLNDAGRQIYETRFLAAKAGRNASAAILSKGQMA